MEHQMSPKMEPPIHPSHTELNPLTGLYDSRGFINQAKAFIPNLPAKEYVMIALVSNISHTHTVSLSLSQTRSTRVSP